MPQKRKTPRPANITIYLGNSETRKERTAKLDELAAQFGLTRSVLIQKIADGEITLIKRPEGNAV